MQCRVPHLVTLYIHCIMCTKRCEAAKRTQSLCALGSFTSIECYFALHCLASERLTPKVLDTTCTMIWSCYTYYGFCSFIHRRRPWSPPKFNQYLIIPPKTHPQISLQFIHNFLSHVVYKQTDGQTDIPRQTNSTKNIRRIGRAQISLTNASDCSQNIIYIIL